MSGRRGSWQRLGARGARGFENMGRAKKGNSARHLPEVTPPQIVHCNIFCHPNESIQWQMDGAGYNAPGALSFPSAALKHEGAKSCGLLTGGEASSTCFLEPILALRNLPGFPERLRNLQAVSIEKIGFHSCRFQKGNLLGNPVNARIPLHGRIQDRVPTSQMRAPAQRKLTGEGVREAGQRLEASAFRGPLPQLGLSEWS